MALSNMKVFQTEVQTAVLEKLPQKLDKFNAASRGAIGKPSLPIGAP